MTSAGPSVVEFNCRFGDPETQSVLALLETPLAGLLHAAATGTLATAGPLRWQPGYAVTVVIAAENYPGRPRVGDVITGSDVDGVLLDGHGQCVSEPAGRAGDRHVAAGFIGGACGKFSGSGVGFGHPP